MPPLIPEKAVTAMALELGRNLTSHQAGLVTTYLQLLEKWNQKMNLVGPGDWQTMLATLVIDSWNLGDFLNGLDLADNHLALDLGAGAGLPGIPLRIFWTKGEYVLVEPRQKRAMFMQTALRTMSLERTRVASCRVEELPENDPPASLVLSRAFCPWRDFLSLASPLLDRKGYCLVMTNQTEPTDIPKGWRLVRSVTYPVGGDQRSFWLFSSNISPS
ncbi:16S rRNA (guanine(527)-N(7))-methyltransferase RsmG [Desulfoplanes sp.]